MREQESFPLAFIGMALSKEEKLRCYQIKSNNL